jgi:hypothetical protein
MGIEGGPEQVQVARNVDDQVEKLRFERDAGRALRRVRRGR